MFTRFKRKELQNALLRSPAVVLLGPRQVGKTTLALNVVQPDGAYLDLDQKARPMAQQPRQALGQIAQGLYS